MGFRAIHSLNVMLKFAWKCVLDRDVIRGKMIVSYVVKLNSE